MKANFKPLGLAAAVAAATAGYAGVAAAQERAVGGIGDLAIIPYYTVRDNFITGVHITNTSGSTQVVKLRLRRGSDSMDALDFNLIMSPYDVWTGFLDDSSGNIVFQTDDNTCTAPYIPSGRFVMPDLYREGAEEGYIEVIAMAQTTSENSPVAISAEHGDDGMPFDCDLVADNFAIDGRQLGNETIVPDVGWRSPSLTWQRWWEDDRDIGDYDLIDQPFPNNYEDSDNALRVSFFVRDAASGLEFGSAAVHIADFADEPMMTNQVKGLFSGDITGFDYPDLNGGLFGLQVRDKFDTIIRPLLGSDTVINDWSNNAALNVATDWVVTLPGQYVMLDYYLYNAEVVGFLECGEEHPDDEDFDDIPECDFRDLPTRVEFFTRDREEFRPTGGDDLVVSPSIPGARPTTEFRYEVNVIEWTDGSDGRDSVLGSEYAVTVNTSAYPQPYGWASLGVSSNNSNGQQVCLFPIGIGEKLSNEINAAGDFNDLLWYGNCEDVTNPSAIPMVGFVAWERSFPSDPSANYGRIIDHAFTSDAD